MKNHVMKLSSASAAKLHEYIFVYFPDRIQSYYYVQGLKGKKMHTRHVEINTH
jgi:hypothetical protein